MLGPRGTGKTYWLKRFLQQYDAVISIDLLHGATYQTYLKSPEQFDREITHYVGTNTFDKVYVFIDKDQLQFGLLPQVVKEDDIDVKRVYLETYVHTYLREEIKEEALVRNIEGFSRFLDVAAQYNGQPVNYSKLSRNVGVSDTAIRNYYEILDDTLIAIRVDGYTFSTKKQLQKSPKYYFFDTGVLNAITGELSLSAKRGTYRYGTLFETMIVHEIRSQMSYQRNSIPMYHYRTSTGQEIDLILQRSPASRPIAIEIKSGENPSAKDVKALLGFRKEYPDAKCIVLCNTAVAYVYDDIEFLPLKAGVAKIAAQKLVDQQ